MNLTNLMPSFAMFNVESMSRANPEGAQAATEENGSNLAFNETLKAAQSKSPQDEFPASTKPKKPENKASRKRGENSGKKHHSIKEKGEPNEQGDASAVEGQGGSDAAASKADSSDAKDAKAASGCEQSVAVSQNSAAAPPTAVQHEDVPAEDADTSSEAAKMKVLLAKGETSNATAKNGEEDQAAAEAKDETSDQGETAGVQEAQADQATAQPPMVKEEKANKIKHAAESLQHRNGESPGQELQAAQAEAQAASTMGTAAIGSTDGDVKASIQQQPPEKPAGNGAMDLLAGMTQADGKPSTSETTTAEAAPHAQESPVHDAQETFDQVVLGLKGKMDARTGKAEIRLDPPNFGTVRVTVSLENGALTAEFQSASDVVRDLLKGNLDKLKSTLQTQGVVVDKLAVDAPPDAGTTTGRNSQESFGSSTHDGRSAGQYQQGGQRSGGGTGDGFARLITQAQEAPLDMVA